MGLENMNFALYLNIAFYSMLGIGILIGFLKGFRRSLYTFIITIIFIGVFFLTVNAVVNQLYTLQIGFLGGLLANISPELNNAASFKEAITILLAQQMGDSLDTSLTNPDFIAFVDAIGKFILKIVYTIVYFTIIHFLYRFILFIISLFIFRKGRSKNKNGKRTRWAGGIFGFLTAAVNVFVMIIVLSGIMSIAESLVSIQAIEASQTVEIYEPHRNSIVNLNNTSESLINHRYQPLAETTNDELSNAIDSLNQIITDYNNNLVIQLSNSIKVEDEVTSEKKSLGIMLFDEVLSIRYKGTNIALRKDLRTFSEVAGIYLNSDFYDTGDLTDFSSTEVNNIFTTLSHSNLLISIIPVGVEVGADYFDVDIELDKETLYEDIVWRDEIQQIGAVASTGFMILESANAFDPDVDYKTVSFNGSDVEDLFDALSESKLVEYGAYLAVEPLLEQASLEMKSVITIPEDINWKDEFTAFGDIASEILSSGITIADLESGDIQQILTVMSDVDLTVLLNSKLTTRALINILSGQSEINLDMQFLVIPDMTYDEWVEYNDLGEVIDGELIRILTSINILVDNVANIDFDDLQIDDLTTLSSDDIDSIFESRVLVASVSEAIRGLSSDELNLIIPDSVVDENNYIIKQEVKNIFNAITMAAGQLPCDVGDTVCEELGFDIEKILSLSGTNIDTLFNSEILFATASNMIMEMGAEQLVIPDEVKITILVEEANLTIVNKTEIKNTFLAISALGLEDFNNIVVDASLLTNLAIADVDDPATPEDETTTLDITKTTKLFASKILHATISKFIIDEATPEPGVEATLIIPYYATEDYDLSGDDVVRNTVGSVEYISEAELTEVLEAILVLDIADFSSFDSLDIGLILANSDELLDSAILHATISDQLIKLDDDGTMTIPNRDDSDSYDLYVTSGTNEEETTFILKAELANTFDALEVLDITDFENVTIDASILTNLAEDGDPTALDTVKSDKIFASKIVHATISKVIFDSTQAVPGEEPDLVVPEEAWEAYPDTTVAVKITNSTLDEYISEAELTELLKAVLALEITDFETVNTLELTDIFNNSDIILGSAIFHATISKQILDLKDSGELTIPEMDEYDTYELVDTVETTDYLIKDEITAILEALEVLNIGDFNTVAIDASILSNLAYEDDPGTVEDESTTLNIAKSDKIFSSKIVHATISKVIYDSTQAVPGEEPDLVVPEEAWEAYPDTTVIVKITNSTLDEYISEAELTELFKSVLALEITDFNTVNNLLLSDIYANSDVILGSAIFHATISKQILDLETSGDLTIPEMDEYDTYELVDTVQTTDYLIKDEINAILDALDALEIYDFNTVAIDASILSNLAYEDDPGTVEDESTTLNIAKSDKIFSSKIVHATISKVIYDSTQAVPGEEPDLVVPEEAWEAYPDTTVIVKITNSTLDEYISEAELTELFKSVLALEITDFNAVNNLLLSDIYANSDVILGSAIFHATISKQILDLETTGELTIPEMDAYDTYELVDTVQTTDYLIKDEITAILEALDVLEIYDFNSVVINTSIFTNLALDGDPTTLDTNKSDKVFASKVVHATISKVIYDSTQADPGEEPDLIVPYYATENYTDFDYLGNPSAQVRITNSTLDDYITALELTQLFEAILALDITDFNVVANFSLTDIIANSTTILDSAILHATISKQVIDLETTSLGEIVVPSKNQAGSDIILVDSSGEGAEFITKVELENTFTALDLLGGINNLSGFTGAIDLNMFYESQDPNYDQNQNDLLNSAIMQATISQKIQNLELDNKISIPSIDIDSNQIEFTYGSDYFIDRDEIKHLINVLDIFGITNMETFGGEFAILSFSSNEDQNTLLESAIMHLTVSDQVLGMTNVNVPMSSLENDLSSVSIRVTRDTSEFIVKNEIKALINVLALFGSENINDFSGSFQISTFVDPGNQTLLLDSATMHATISEQILDLDNTGTIVTPIKSVTETWVRYPMAGTNTYNEYILKSEVRYLINGLDLLGANNIDQFDGNLDISGLALGTDQDKVLDSATLHATFSNELIGLNNNVLFVPIYSEDGEIEANRIRVTPSTTEFVVKNEIKAILSSFIDMGYGDLSSFGATIDTSKFFTNVDLYLQSSSIQATISNKILASTLLVPDKTEDGLTDIKIFQTDITYILKSELEFMFAALQTLGINDFAITNVSGNVTQLNSTLATRQEQVDEKRLELQEVLLSGIMHLTIDSIIQANGNISIPDLALDTLFGSATGIVIDVASIQSQQEITNFIIASSILTESTTDDISNVTIDFNTIKNLSTEDQGFVLDSMIVRDIITPSIETAVLIDPGYTLAASDYENNDTNTFLTKQAIIDYLAYAS